MPWYTFGVWNSWQLDPNYNLTGSSSSSGSNRVEAVSTLRDRTPAPQAEALEEAEVIWGKPSSFTWGSRALDFANGPDIRFGGLGGVTFPPEEEEDPAELPPLVDQWNEVSRVERDVRIDGPDGAYVDFKRVDEITWQLPPLPDGRQHYVTQIFKKFGDE